MRAGALVNELKKTPDSRVYAAMAEVQPRSRVEHVLVGISNVVVNGWQAKPEQKRPAMIKIEKPKDPRKRSNVKYTEEEQVQRFSRVKIKGKEHINPITGRPFE